MLQLHLTKKCSTLTLTLVWIKRINKNAPILLACVVTNQILSRIIFSNVTCDRLYDYDNYDLHDNINYK